MNQAAKAPAIVGSNSARTESCGTIRPDPEAQAVSTLLKVANPSGYQQIIRQSREMVLQRESGCGQEERWARTASWRSASEPHTARQSRSSVGSRIR